MERTNVTDKGFTYNGQNFSKESRVDSQGQSYTIDTPNTISAQSLMGGQQAPIVPVAPDFNVDTTTIPQVTSYLQSASDAAQANVDTQNEEALKTGNNIASLQEMLGGRASDTQSAMKATGATDIAAQLRNLNAQSIALGQDSLAKTLAEQNKATGQNITSTAVQRNIGDATRENTINVAKIGIQAAIAQADYATARDLAETIVSAKYDRITAQIEAGRTNLALLEKYKLTPLEEKAKKAQESLFKKQESDALQARQQETRAYNEQIDNKKEISKMMVEASQNAPASVLAKAKAIADDGGSAMAVAQVLGQFGGDYLKNQLLKEQIKKVRAERIEIDTKNNPIRQDSTGLISAPNGDSLSSLPTNTLLNIGKMKLNEGQANAVAFVTRMVQSDQAINRQLSAKYNPTTIVSGLGRVVSSDASRDYNRNAEDFIRAQLRKESGAAIPDSEIEGAKKLYVASGFGQDEKDIKQAAIKRDTAIKSMIAQAGPASVQMLQYYEQVKSGSGTVMSQNPQLNTWFLQTSRAANTSTTQATSGFGFTDNQL